MIPARAGSTRLKMKNLALINGKPMIYYAIQAAKKSNVFDKIVVNSDNELFSKIAERYDVDFYLRPEFLGGSNIKSDDVVYNFIQNYQSDILVWVNPISPLQTGKEISKVVNYFMQHDLNSLITVKNHNVHCLSDGKPVNFSVENKFEKTQDLNFVQAMVYSIMMWKTASFSKAMETKGHAILHDKIGYFPVNDFSSIIVKTSFDLKLVNSVMKIIDSNGENIEYDELINDL